jgi:hypothetical protein
MLFRKNLAKPATVKKSLWITNTIVSFCLDIKKLLPNNISLMASK